MYSLEISVLKTVAYFNIFFYPLTFNEIIFFLDKPAPREEVLAAVTNLAKKNQLWQFNNFYSIRNEPGIATHRMDGNNLASEHIKKAKSVAKFLSWFPYIRGIAVSGSLSKYFADENSDLDFFIITKANRLWIVRILYSVLYKMAAIAGIKSWFCLNYFIDELKMEIPEHNIFTAIEVATLMPLKGSPVFNEFFKANNWVYEYVPNYKPNYKYIKDASPVLLKRITEWILNGKAGNKLDDKLLSFFKKRFDRLTVENRLTDKGLTIGAYEAGKHVCKPLPQYFQPGILSKFQECFMQVKDKYLCKIVNKEKTM